VGRERRAEHHSRADGEQPADDRPAEARPAVHEGDRHQGRLHHAPEDDLRDKASQEFSSQAHQYDVATLSNFEIPIYSKNGWLQSMDSYLAKDPSFDQADILKPIAESLTANGKVYGEPFYGESSFLMYRKDILAAKGLTVPPIRPGSRSRIWPRRWTAHSRG
jgi:ABC-type sugar transport system, periplasmic component